MRFIELLGGRETALRQNKIPTAVFLGDSITQGCFEFYRVGEDFATVFDKEHSYTEYFSRILSELYPKCSVKIVNAGISGDNSLGGFRRIERDVLSHSPDLTVVCFGLNDSLNGRAGVAKFASNMESIIKTLKEAGSEVIVLTPNMACDRLSPHVTDRVLLRLAEQISALTRDGVIDEYVNAERRVAEENGVPICDVYAKWRAMSEAGVDITELLSNRINHPTREMNMLYAYSLIDTLIMN